jgi:RNA polymerase sigma-70 factor (ECF subfamily)
VSFPATHLSLFGRIRSTDVATRTRARDALASVYWQPIYTHVRLTHRLDPADVEDLVQGFFAEALRRDLFARFDPERGRFRTYLRTCVDSYVANVFEADRRQKRGGRVTLLSLEAMDVERRLTTADCTGDADATFHREWVRAVIAAALARLRADYLARGREVHLRLFECYDIEPTAAHCRPTYGELARRFEVSPTQVTNWLAATRRDFREAALATLRDLSATDDELRADVRSLLGVDLS